MQTQWKKRGVKHRKKKQEKTMLGFGEKKQRPSGRKRKIRDLGPGLKSIQLAKKSFSLLRQGRLMCYVGWSKTHPKKKQKAEKADQKKPKKNPRKKKQSQPHPPNTQKGNPHLIPDIGRSREVKLLIEAGGFSRDFVGRSENARDSAPRS